MTPTLTHSELTNNQLELSILDEIISTHRYGNAPLEFLLTRYLGWDEVTTGQFVDNFNAEKLKRESDCSSKCCCGE